MYGAEAVPVLAFACGPRLGGGARTAASGPASPSVAIGKSPISYEALDEPSLATRRPTLTSDGKAKGRRYLIEEEATKRGQSPPMPWASRCVLTAAEHASVSPIHCVTRFSFVRECRRCLGLASQPLSHRPDPNSRPNRRGRDQRGV